MSALRYIDLAKWCGQEIRSDKRGSIPSDLSAILSRSGLDGQPLLRAVFKSGTSLQATNDRGKWPRVRLPLRSLQFNRNRRLA